MGTTPKVEMGGAKVLPEVSARILWMAAVELIWCFITPPLKQFMLISPVVWAQAVTLKVIRMPALKALQAQPLMTP